MIYTVIRLQNVMDRRLVLAKIICSSIQHVIVSASINNLNSQGQVMINGVEWTARSKNGEAIEAGTEVVVTDIQGVKAIVEKA